ncbi:MAG: phospho-N-acetylmuramoyl-pentapeptide-transferase, partial [Verrucomicrobiae bacterium]|nr:phospho-N-acetylmuramoyl-pentapeptide-transferase [Verrucomicrobiae bacterium]
MLPALYDFWLNAYNDGEAWAVPFRFLNLFQYITFRAASAGLLAFVLSLVFGPRVIRKLISLKVGQPIRTAAEVHKLAELHGGKLGTPTMGGVLILGTVLVSTLVCARPLNPFVAVCACTMAACGLLGFCDDYKKVKERKSDGVSGRTKLFWQFLIALIAASFVYFKPEISGIGASADAINAGEAGYYLGKGNPIGIGSVCFPLFKEPIINLGILIIPFFALVIVGTSNAVNLTDGLDGLATGCVATAAIAYAGITYAVGRVDWAEYLLVPHVAGAGEMTVLMTALLGGALGFLWFNAAPALVFMGDVGSLGLGGALGYAALVSRTEIVLLVVGGVFVVEALSVIIQVGYFKSTGKRFFRVAPIHHHFHLGGWTETQTVVRFWLTAA